MSTYDGYKKEYYESHKEQYRESAKKWSNKNKDKISAYQRSMFQRIKERHGIGSGTVQRYGIDLALKIYNKFDWSCYECGDKDDLTIHHDDHKGRNYKNKGLPMNNKEENLTLMCRKCHGSLHTKERWGKICQTS